MTDEMKWKKQLKDKALELKTKIIAILSSDSDWFDEKSKRYLAKKRRKVKKGVQKRHIVSIYI